MMVVSLAKSLAKRANNQANLQENTKKTVQYSLENFPLSPNPDVVKAGNQWSEIYGGTSSQQEIVRHLIDLFQMIDMIALDREFLALAAGLIQILRNPDLVGQNESNRAELIHRIQTGTMSKAEAAYNEFNQKYGLHSKAKQLEATIQLSANLFGREIRHGRIGMAITIWKTVKEIGVSHPNLHSYIMSEMIESVSPSRSFLRMKINLLMIGHKVDPKLAEMITELKAMNYIGMGNNKMAEIRTGQTYIPEAPLVS